MSSRKPAQVDLDLDFDRDMPLTAADLEALARARLLPPLPTEDYLQWLTAMSKHHGRPPHRDNTDSDEPFTL